MSRMRAGFAIAVLASSALPASAGPRPGHAVRVERVHRMNGTPRLCVMQGASTMLCLGAKPEAGDAIEFVDESHYLGTAHVARAEARCKGEQPERWNVEASFDGELAPTESALALGIIGVPLDHRNAHVLTLDDPNLTTDMAPVKAFGVDVDGKGKSAIAFVLGQCTASSVPSFCFDVWVDRDGRGLARTTHDTFSEDCL